MATKIMATTPFKETTEATVLVTDNELLGRYLFKDDANAFEELVRRHSGLVMGLCRNMLFHSHDAEDAFQATFLILSRKSRSLLDHGSIAGWLYQTAMRNCLQIRRRKGRARETEMIEEPAGTNEPWQTISNAQEAELIYQEINRLPKRYRDAIVLCHLQGHSRSEAAEFLDWTEAGVKAALSRGRNLLRRRLIRSGLMTSVAIGMLNASTVKAQSIISEPLINSTLQHCSGLTPTISVGNGPHLVQTLSNSGVLSMQTATIIKSFSLTASIALAVCVPLGLIAQQTELGLSSGDTIVSKLGSGQQGDGDVAASEIEVGSSIETISASHFGDETSTADAPISDSFALLKANTDATQLESEQPGFSDSNGATDLIGSSNGVDGAGEYSTENSKEYWELMLMSYKAQVKSLERKTKPKQGLIEGDRFELLSRKYEAEAKAIEAELNLKRISESAKPKTSPAPWRDVAPPKRDAAPADDRFSIIRDNERFLPQSLVNYRKYVKAKEFAKAADVMEGVTKLEPDSELAKYMQEVLKESRDKEAAEQNSHPHVAGLVVKVNEDGLFVISLGTDDGLRVGHTVQVHRENKFIGKAVVIQTKPDLSAARMKSLPVGVNGKTEEEAVRESDGVLVDFSVKPNGARSRTDVYLQILRSACNAYRLQDGRYPNSLNDLFRKPAGLSKVQWGGPYLEKPVGLDAWGNDYGYAPDEGAVNPGIYSIGPDGIAGTADDVGAERISGAARAALSKKANHTIKLLLKLFDKMIEDQKFNEAVAVQRRVTHLFPDSNAAKYVQRVIQEQSQAIELSALARSSSAVPPSAKDPVAPGEVLLIESLSDPRLNRQVVVRSDHTISMPLVGTVSVRDQTTKEITQIVETKLAKFMKSPQIFVVRESASTPLKSKQ